MFRHGLLDPKVYPVYQCPRKRRVPEGTVVAIASGDFLNFVALCYKYCEVGGRFGREALPIFKKKHEKTENLE